MWHKNVRKSGVVALLALITVLLTVTIFPGWLMAEDSFEEAISTLEAGQRVDGPGFFGGRLVKIDGTVEGTAFASGEDIRVAGTINGDLFVAGRNVSVTGDISGNIYAAGQNIVIDTSNSRDVFAAGETMKIPQDAQIGRDMFFAGRIINLDGSVGRNLFGGVADIIIGGSVGKDVNLAANNVRLLDGAVINGNFKYESPNQADAAPGATIRGESDWKKEEPAPETQRNVSDIAGDVVLGILSALLIWFLVKIWRPESWANIALPIKQEPLKTIGVGLLTLIVTPILVILSLITVIGIPLGIILALVYVVSVYLSKIIVAVFFGSWLTERFGWTERHQGVWPVLLSLTVLALLMKVPYVNVLVWLLIAFTGLGALVMSNYKTSA